MSGDDGGESGGDGATRILMRWFSDGGNGGDDIGDGECVMAVVMAI